MLFQASSVVVLRLGDANNSATAAAPGIALPVYLDEFSTTGARVQSVKVPTMTLYASNPVTCLSTYQTGVPVPLGLLTRSPDGTALGLAGPNVAAGTAYAATSITWTLATVTYTATFNTSTQVADHYAGDLWSSAVPIGPAFWTGDTISSSGAGRGVSQSSVTTCRERRGWSAKSIRVWRRFARRIR